jgi:hypothetical protein
MTQAQYPTGYTVPLQQAALGVAQHQQRTAGYLNNQGQCTNAPMIQLPQSREHTRAHAHAPMQNPSMYAGPFPTAPPRWSNAAHTRAQGYSCDNSGPITYARRVKMQACQQQPYTSPLHATGGHPGHIPFGPSSSGDRSFLPCFSTPFIANAPLELAPLSAGSRSVADGPTHVSTIDPQVLPEFALPFPENNSLRCPSGLSAIDDMGFRAGEPLDLYHSTKRDGTECHTEVLLPPSHGPRVSSRPTPVEVFSSADNPPSRVPPSIESAGVTIYGQISSSEAARTSSDANVCSTNGKPASPNRKIGPDRSDRSLVMRKMKPYQRPAPSAARKTRLIPHEGNLDRLQQRCMGQGADDGVIRLLGVIFAKEVSLEALTRPFTDADVETEEFGIRPGQVYTALLEHTIEQEGVTPRHICRLCHSNQTWKHSRDVLRHLRRDHFGLAEICGNWYIFNRYSSLAGANVISGDAVAESSTPSLRWHGTPASNLT